MDIRKAVPAELDRIMEIFDYAREFMKRSGNPNQWIDGYPQRELIEKDIHNGHCYVCTLDGEIEGVCMLMPGDDPSYKVIVDGAWLNDEPYCTMHRMAGSGKVKGIADLFFGYFSELCPNLRGDTHDDNKIMQHLLEKNGFVRCGKIFVANGSSRIAYHKVRK